MRLNRRNALIGMGTMVIGGGTALGTGAFSSVEATRTVSVDVAGDASALVALEVNQDYGNVDGNGQVEINLSSDNLGEDADGLNRNGTTTFDGMLAVTNQHEEDVDFTLPDTSDDEEADIEAWFELNEDFDVTNDGNFGSDPTAADTGVNDDNGVSNGETAVYDLVVDVRDASTDESEPFEIDVTIEAKEV
ncbi:hypothetical protein ACFQGT_19590 [Natrialbaceae archaeon GCM10025810]